MPGAALAARAEAVRQQRVYDRGVPVKPLLVGQSWPDRLDSCDKR